MSDVFEEVEERLREDAVTHFVRRWGPTIAIAAGAVLAVAVAAVLFLEWRTSENRKDTAALYQAQQKALADPKGAAAEFAKLEKTAGGGLKGVAAMNRAAALQADGDLKGALAAYDAAAKMVSDPVAKEATQLRAAYLAADFETLADLDKRLKSIVDGRGPFSYPARELLGVKALDSGDTARARAEFSYLQLAPDAPADLRDRASVLLQAAGPAPTADAAAPAPAAPTTQPGEKK